ncbi:hypothetical protein FHT00_002009 [Sphingomonas insulae]|uniref:Putative auto-transporter adhesin head GIN domain-containing protein n=1 Tax=Sphingomonas insulae TaxID=424800 RepID=A0ABN1HMG6_9SPHN|nr:DUF2807 domain-containing protein [Sphingomonas insulae]NIJ30046.1 hypothetical protein [Sphingomonas insulae]
MLRILIALALLCPAVASAEERRVNVGSFEKLRVSGAFDVTVTTGGSPGATVTGDRAAIGDIDLHTEGATLIVRRNPNGRWSEQGQAATTRPVAIVLTTPRLASVAVVGGSRIAVSRLAAPRIDLAATGAGAITVGAVEGDQLTAQLIGEGKISVAGKAATARLLANGAGTIDAAGLEVGDLAVHLDGLGSVTARARYTAQVSNTGLGTITIAGRPKCRVTAIAGAPVTCGAAQ